MTPSSKNLDAQKFLNDCDSELDEIKLILKKIGRFDQQVSYLTRYSIILSASSLELFYKKLITDKCEAGGSSQLRFFLGRKFGKSPINLKYDSLCRSLTDFDKNWNSHFKDNLCKLKSADEWKTSLDSLIDLRNEFAHGGRPTVTFTDIKTYFKHSRRIMNVLERSLL